MGGFLFGCIASYFLFLWWVGDIGSRPKLYNEHTCEEYEFGFIRGKLFPVYEFETGYYIRTSFCIQ